MKNVQNNLDLCKDEHNRKNTYIDGLSYCCIRMCKPLCANHLSLHTKKLTQKAFN